MQINLFNNIFPYNCSAKNNNYTSTPNLSSNLAPLKYDTVSFGALKKSQFNGLDRAIVEKFKAPLEKFKTLEDFQSWASKKVSEILSKDYEAFNEQVTIQRKSIIDEWIKYLTSGGEMFTPAVSLLILSGITSNLKPNENKLPPVLNREVLSDTISEIEHDLEVDGKKQFNFLKMYREKLQAFYSSDSIGVGETGWVVIPSKEHDPQNFETNIEKLQALSHNNWCTKGGMAETYLGEGDFHIYLENSQPKIGMRFKGEKIEEIQGELNNTKIPQKYLSTLEEYVDGNKYRLNKKARDEFFVAMDAEEKIEILKEKLGEDVITNSDPKVILPYFRITVQEDSEGFLTLSHYEQPDDNITFEDLGIDEKKLFEKVKRINGDAYFYSSKLNTLGNLEYIGGDVYFGKCLITDLGALKTINGSLSLAKNNSIHSLNNVEYIGGNLLLDESRLKSLGKLKTIEGKADFRESRVEDLGDLEYIGGTADFRESIVESLGKLKFIGQTAYLNNSNIEDMGNLEIIGGNVYFRHSPIKDLKSLKYIEGFADFSHSDVENLGALESFGDYDIENSPLKESDFVGRGEYEDEEEDFDRYMDSIDDDDIY